MTVYVVVGRCPLYAIWLTMSHPLTGYMTEVCTVKCEINRQVQCQGVMGEYEQRMKLQE